MTTVIDSLAAELASIPADTPLCIGLSGGLDSVVLLHGLCQLVPHHRLRAIHINHHLSQSADLWQQHCAGLCETLAVEFVATSVDVKGVLKASGAGVEATARTLRYQSFADNLHKDELLLLAHHLDDQIETLLLRLMRGAGVRGLSSIPASRDVGEGKLLRPLLGVTREQLLNYATSNDLKWVEDDSNSDTRFDRNFCRHEILPALATRWPNYRESMSKSLQLVTEAADIVDELAAQDAASATEAGMCVVDLQFLKGLSEPRQRNALRYWLSAIAAPELGWKPLNDLISKLKSHRGAGQVLVLSSVFQLVAFKEKLHALRVLPAAKPPAEDWAMASQDVFVLPDNGELVLRASVASPRLPTVSVRYRKGGEVLKRQGRPTKSLKQIFQEAAVPPWLRDRVPLIYSAETLVCIPGFGPCVPALLHSADERFHVDIVWNQGEFNWFETSKSD